MKPRFTFSHTSTLSLAGAVLIHSIFSTTTFALPAENVPPRSVVSNYIDAHNNFIPSVTRPVQITPGEEVGEDDDSDEWERDELPRGGRGGGGGCTIL